MHGNLEDTTFVSGVPQNSGSFVPLDPEIVYVWGLETFGIEARRVVRVTSGLSMCLHAVEGGLRRGAGLLEAVGELQSIFLGVRLKRVWLICHIFSIGTLRGAIFFLAEPRCLI